MLDELNVPIGDKDLDLEKAELNICLRVIGPVQWKPSVPSESWHDSERKIIQVFISLISLIDVSSCVASTKTCNHDIYSTIYFMSACLSCSSDICIYI